ncbi:hypothetical protein NLJ89_g3577 [Agrocybe chaxingu]|uniref:RNase III domain-containing protein n=1 Tax=Agrocybe chaxingu TaxID=84603 RepID=A0A9W8MYF6_9AGAR|nr:hypothetical protein NLJ89_g3577 [Agrocybe chaxingu]
MLGFLNHPLTAFVCAYTIYCLMKWYRLRKLMPPGPLGLPFIGNKHELPAIKPWKKFAELNKRYGPVTSIFLGDTPVIICGTAQPAWDLLEKRSDIYSSRPRFVVAIFQVLHSGFHSRQAATYKDIQSLESKVLIKQILDDPKGYERHVQRFAASVAVSVTYGKRINSVDEWVVKENMDAMDCTQATWNPILTSSNAKCYLHGFLVSMLYNEVKARMSNGTIPDCLTSQCITNIKQLGMSNLELAYAVSNLWHEYIVLAMLHFPEVQKKVQAELDAIVGQDRMPEYEDQASLPYVRAVINEALRWRPVAILGGTPHASTADDVYNGMFIPKGSTIFANFYGIMRDPEMFPEPECFRPERFIETTNPRLLQFDLPFGFGRRSCPGIHLALNSLFINFARMLWAFDIKPALDQDGKEIIPDSENYTNGFNSRPLTSRRNMNKRDRNWIDGSEALSGNWGVDDIVPLPAIKSEQRLRRARNSVKRSKDNNDILEFIGDRVNNLVCTLMVEKVKMSSEHHKVVGRVLCNNDTLGRIAYQLGMHQEAILGHHDKKEVKAWLPTSKESPPKALADLFEAYVGAIYEEQGWKVVIKWLTALYKPLMDLATEDFLNRPDPTRPIPDRPSEEPQEIVVYQGKLLDYLEFKRASLVESGQEAIDALPSGVQFFFGIDGNLMNDADRAEWITRLITSDESIGYLGYLLSLSGFFDPEDVDFQSTRRFTITQDIVYRNKLSSSLKAIVGWYYLKDSARAEKWGEKWFKFIVMRAHDIIADDPNYKLSLPESALDTYSIHAAAVVASDQKLNYTPTSLADLARYLESISLSHSQREEPTGEDEEPESVILVARVEDKSLNRFRPLPKVSLKLSSGSKHSEASEFNSREADTTTASALVIKKESGPKSVKDLSLRVNIAEKLQAPEMSMEQSLIPAFKDIKIGGVAADIKVPPKKANAPLKHDISPEAVSRLGLGQSGAL